MRGQHTKILTMIFMMKKYFPNNNFAIFFLKKEVFVACVAFTKNYEEIIKEQKVLCFFFSV
jgi:hypothetical protein